MVELMRAGRTPEELLARHRLRTQAEVRMVIFEFIEGWYNPHRRPSALAYLPSIVYERAAPGTTPTPGERNEHEPCTIS